MGADGEGGAGVDDSRIQGWGWHRRWLGAHGQQQVVLRLGNAAVFNSTQPLAQASTLMGDARSGTNSIVFGHLFRTEQH